MFKLNSSFKPAGDQPSAIEKLTAGILAGKKCQTLLGVTGSGKTFTMAAVIERTRRPVLVISPNKTLAAQLWQEFREFFPENAVHYFVSYYDYYQPESYIPQTDTYIAKDAKINEEIDRLRYGATQALMARNDVIIVASVSCIYGIGDPAEYEKVSFEIKPGQLLKPAELAKSLVLLQYVRNDAAPRAGEFRMRGNRAEIHPPAGGEAIKIEFGKNRVAEISGKPRWGSAKIYPAKHFVAPRQKLFLATGNIRRELKERLSELKKMGKHTEAERLERRTNYDLAMLRQTGYSPGIENYSRHFSFRRPGEPPFTLVDYYRHRFGKDFLVFIDESHIAVPQIRGMHRGDRSRKKTLVEYGWRLPSAIDNRPLTLKEFESKVSQTVYISATPGDYEIEKSSIRSLRRTAQKLSICHCSPRLFKGTPKGRGEGEAPYINFGKSPLATKKRRMSAEVVLRGEARGNPEGIASSDRFIGASNDGVIEQFIRPTGLLDPNIEIRSAKNQVKNLVSEIKKCVEKKERVLVIALTKRLAEDLADFLGERDIKSHYLHSEVKTMERSSRLEDLRSGTVDVVVGINLLREGLDLPEVALVAVLDADKEGFLRDETTLIQIVGRASRHIDGRAIFYADVLTGSMKKAIEETRRRRRVQEEFNRLHGIVPKSIRKEIRPAFDFGGKDAKKNRAIPPACPVVMPKAYTIGDIRENPSIIKELEKEMKIAAKNLDFEKAAKLRDFIKKILRDKIS